MPATPGLTAHSAATPGGTTFADSQLVIGDDSGADGVQRAADGADDWWWLVAMRAMGWLADTHTVFEAYDLTLLGVPDPAHPNHWGALFRAASTAGTIEPAGYARARRPTRAGGLCRVWIGAS